MGKTTRTGPKGKLSLAVIATIARHVRAGAHLEEAATAAGVSRSSLQGWLLKGRLPEDTLERRLCEAVDTAQGTHATKMHGTISRAAKKQWKAAEASLKLSNQSRYGQGRIEFQVSLQLKAAIDRLRDEFTNEPQIFERILACVAGVDGGGGTPFASPGESSGATPAVGAVDPSQADPAAVGIPRPHM